MADPFEETFPNYSELTQTPGWGRDTTAVDLVVGEAFEDARYTETALLGQGGMGKVVVARDARVGREVALKVLHTEREVPAEMRARFLREARVQGQLEHPAIVP